MVELHSFFNRHAAVLPHDLKAQMASYYSDVWIRSLRQTDDAALMRELPHDLRCEVSFHVLEPALRRIFRGAGENSLRALAHRLTKRTVLRGTSLFYDLSDVDVSGSGSGTSGSTRGGGTFFIVMEGDMLVTIPTPAATAEARDTANHYQINNTHHNYRFEPTVADVEEHEYRVLGVVKPGNAFSYVGAEALVTGLENQDRVNGVLRELDVQGADASRTRDGSGGCGSGSVDVFCGGSQATKTTRVTRVTALSTAEIYEITPAAAVRLIVVERTDLLYALVANAKAELEHLRGARSSTTTDAFSPSPSSLSSSSLLPVLERSLEVMTAVARVV